MRRRPLLIRLLRHHALGGQKQARHRGRVLQRAAHDLGRVDDAGLHQVLELLGGRVEAEGALVVPDLVDHHRAFPPGIAGDPAGGILERLADDPDADLLVLAGAQVVQRRRARMSATPPPGTTPSSTAARVACSASSTRAFFSFISISVAAPTRMTATPPTSLASRSCSFSRS